MVAQLLHWQIVWELYSNLTKSGSNTDSWWRDVYIYYSHLSQDIFCPGSNWYDQTNCCENIHCSCITTRFYEWALKSFLPEIEQMNEQQFEKQSGYELHQRMAHSTNQNIRESISCTTGMESLIGQKWKYHVKCPCKESIMHDWKSYNLRLSFIEKESGTTIVSNQHGLIFIICQVCRRISAYCGVGRQPDRISMNTWNKDQGWDNQGCETMV